MKRGPSRKRGAGSATASPPTPGAIRTNLQRQVEDDEATKRRWAESEPDGSLFWKSAAQGAATSVLLATSPQLAGVGGRYLEDCNEAAVNDDDVRVRRGVRSYALAATQAPLGRLAEHARDAGQRRQVTGTQVR